MMWMDVCEGEREEVCSTLFLSQVNSSLIFFLLSFQVHEKSILLSVLPSSLLSHHHPHTVTWFQLLALFSMYPLVTQDGLSLACWALGGLYFVVSIFIQPTGGVPGTSWYTGLCKMMVSVCVCVSASEGLSFSM